MWLEKAGSTSRTTSPCRTRKDAMRKTFSLLAATILLATIVHAESPDRTPRFPTLVEQLQAAHVAPGAGTPLEQLIRENQDFSRLTARDMADRIVPPWLKVYWQKGHPEVNYANSDDPTGGYPLGL